MTFLPLMSIIIQLYFVVEPMQSQDNRLLFSTHAKPSCFAVRNDLIAVGQDNQQILLLQAEHPKKHSIISTQCQDRTLSLRMSDNLLVRGSNQGIVALWDLRQHTSPIHSFLKQGSKIRAIDLSQHILAAGSNKRLVFWDLRKMKQRCEFTQSFNEEITGLQFSKQLPMVFHACSMDGLIARFDLTQPNQEEAFAWGHQIMESPTKLQLQGNITLIETDNQAVLTLLEESLKDRYCVNSVQNPTHLLGSYLGPQQRICYFTKAMRSKSVEFWIGNYQTGYLATKADVQMLIPLPEEKVLFADAEGNWYQSTVTRGTPQQKSVRNQNFMTVEELQAQVGKKVESQQACNKNGFIVSKPSTLKSHSQKFKPY